MSVHEQLAHVGGPAGDDVIDLTLIRSLHNQMKSPAEVCRGHHSPKARGGDRLTCVTRLHSGNGTELVVDGSREARFSHAETDLIEGPKPVRDVCSRAINATASMLSLAHANWLVIKHNLARWRPISLPLGISIMTPR